MLLISSFYLDWVSVRRNKRKEKPKLLLKILKALSAPVKAKPAFEAHGFDIINSYRRRCRDSQVRLVSTQQVWEEVEVVVVLVGYYSTMTNLSTSIKREEEQGRYDGNMWYSGWQPIRGLGCLVSANQRMTLRPLFLIKPFLLIWPYCLNITENFMFKLCMVEFLT